MSNSQDTTSNSSQTETTQFSFNDAGEAKLIAAARELRPLLVENTQKHAEIGEMTQEVVDAVVKAGFHKMAVPTRWNGEHLSAKSMARIAAELAKGCASAAWAITITNSCVLVGSQQTDKMQQTLFANGTPLMAASIAGMGSIEKTEGGYLLSGRWDYCTNCHHAQYMLLRGIDGPDMIHCVVPTSDLTRLDNWDMVGMRGTGSESMTAEEVFVPTELTAKLDGFGVEGGFSYQKEASDNWRMFPLVRAKALGVLVGAVEAQLEDVVAGSTRPAVYSNFEQKQDSGAFRGIIGDVASKISVARTVMDAVNDVVDHAALEARDLSHNEALKIRAEASYSIKMLSEASNTLMDLAGSGAFSESKLAQRYWLDFNVGARHAIFNPYTSFEAYGDHVLGRELTVMDAVWL